MRVLKYTLGFMAVCFAGFFVIGIIWPVISYETSITVKRPLAKSWNVFTTDTLARYWAKGFSQAELVEGNEHEPGSRYLMTAENNGKKFQMSETVKEWKENERYAFILENEMLTNNMEISFSEPALYTTRIELKNTIRANNMFMRSMFVFLKSSFKKNDDENLYQLKKLIESKKN